MSELVVVDASLALKWVIPVDVLLTVLTWLSIMCSDILRTTCARNWLSRRDCCLMHP
jgi:hypothetical protein